MVLDLFDTSIKISRNSAMRICHLILMENKRYLGIYTRRKYERHHGCPRLWEEFTTRVLREGMPADDGEKELVSRHSSRLQLDPVCKRPKVIAELTEG
jgi:hypothetical protein